MKLDFYWKYWLVSWWLINAIGDGATPVPFLTSAHRIKGNKPSGILVNRFNS